MEIKTVEIIFYIICFCIGAIFGSFACCQAWRLRIWEVGKKNAKVKKIGKRSVCLSCGHQLSFSENIPIFSWLHQKGRCKKCHKKIGYAEILSEVSLGLAFVGLGIMLWPEIIYRSSFFVFDIITAGMILAIAASLVLMWIVMIYDGKWGRMPTIILVALNLSAVFLVCLKYSYMAMNGNFLQDAIPSFLNLLGSMAILAGTYFALYIISGEKAVGGGDWLLALPISLILGDWKAALLVLCLSNFAASVFGIVKKIKTKSSRIYFGPFLVISFAVVFFLVR